MNKTIDKGVYKRTSRFLFVFALAAFLVVSSFIFFVINPRRAKSANFTSVTTTLSNPRLSYKAGVTSGTTLQTLITIDGSGNPDNDTNHLFVKDNVCFASSTYSGCRDNIPYSVVNTPTTTTFNVSPALTTTLNAADYAIATQSGIMTISFTLTNDIPADGDILVTIPMANDQDGDDGFPDANGTGTSTGGFDLGPPAAGGISTDDISVTESCGGTFSVAAVNIGSGSTDHTIEINNATAACAATSVLTVTIGDADATIINPAPVTSTRNRGEAEIYTINVKTRNGSNGTIDNSDTLVAPIEGVFVSATVDESLAFTVVGVGTTTGSYCGAARTASSPTSTAYSIPWGTLSTTYLAATHNAVQMLTVTTNADSGYEVYIQEQDQMGKDGAACSGVAPSSGDFTFTGPTTCIRDTLCWSGTAWTHVVGREWGADPSSYPGMGYSLQNVSGEGTDAEFVYNSSTDPCDASASTGNYCAKQIADYDRGSGSSEDETANGAEIMSNGDPVDTNSTYVCYRIDLPGTQPAGYYYTTIKYTAVPSF